MKNETENWKLNKIIAFDSGNAGYVVSESPIFNFFFPGEYAPEPPYIITKNSIPGQND